MTGPLIFAWGLVALLALLVWRKEGGAGLRAAATSTLGLGRNLAMRLPFALLAAAFLVQILPVATLSRMIGPDSGLSGIVIAALIGGLLPGGPMTSFPIAIVFQQGGAGFPQLVALLGGWSVFAMHRLLSYEAPIMGWRFVMLRSLSCAILPVIGGLLAELTLGLF